MSSQDCVMVPRKDIAAVIEDIRLGCPSVAVKHLTAMLSAAPAEPAAWQYRLKGTNGTTKWRECNDDVRKMIAASGHYDGAYAAPAELRPLYAVSGLTPHSTARCREWGQRAADAVITSPDVGKMVARLRANDGEEIDFVRDSISLLLALDAERGRLREALKFYADISKYPAPLTGGMGELWSDCGQVARSALPASDEGTNNE